VILVSSGLGANQHNLRRVEATQASAKTRDGREPHRFVLSLSLWRSLAFSWIAGIYVSCTSSGLLCPVVILKGLFTSICMKAVSAKDMQMITLDELILVFHLHHLGRQLAQSRGETEMRSPRPCGVPSDDVDDDQHGRHDHELEQLLQLSLLV
jgi:hypothetical protein